MPITVKIVKISTTSTFLKIDFNRFPNSVRKSRIIAVLRVL